MTKLPHPSKLVEAITKQLGGVYRLKNGNCVMGQAFTYLQKNLRELGWRAVTEYNLETLVNATQGLGWGRGHGQRHFHGGKLAFGGLCTVIYRLPAFPPAMVEQAQVMCANIMDVVVDDSFLVIMHRHTQKYDYTVSRWSLSRGFYDGQDFEESVDARASFVTRQGGIESRMVGELGGRP